MTERVRRWVATRRLCLWILVFAGCANPASERLLSPGFDHHQPAQAGSVDPFAFELKAGEVIRLDVEQQGVDVSLLLADPRGRVLMDADSLNGTEGPEYLVFSAEQPGRFQLSVKALDGQGTYRLRAPVLGPPTPLERQWLQVLEHLRQADEADRAHREEEALRQALAVSLQSSDAAAQSEFPGLVRARIHRRLGQVLNRMGHLQEARQHFQEARALFEKHGNAWEQGPALLDLSDILFSLGDLDAQQDACLRALKVAEPIRHYEVMAAAWNNLGVHASASARPSRALFAYGRALRLWQGVLHRREQALFALHNLGIQFLILGRDHEGVETLNRVVVERREMGGSLALAEALRTLAANSWFISEGGYPGKDPQIRGAEASLEIFAEAIALLESLHAARALSVALEYRSRLLRALHRFVEASADLRRALFLIEGLDEADRVHRAWIQVGFGAWWREIGRPDQAEVWLRQADQSFSRLDLAGGKVVVQIELARVARIRGDLEQADRHWRSVLKGLESERTDLRRLSFRRSYLASREELYGEHIDLLAELAVEQGSSSQVEQGSSSQVEQGSSNEVEQGSSSQVEQGSSSRLWARRAFEAAERVKARTLLDRLAQGALPVESWSGNPQRSELARFVEALEAERLVPDPESLPGHRSVGLIDVEDAQPLDTLRHARLELERLQESDARRARSTPSARLVELDSVQARLDDQTVMLAYALLDGRSWLWRIDSHRIAIYPLASRAQLNDAATRAHEVLRRSSEEAFSLAAERASESLADSLLAPVLHTLEGVERLVIVPDGALHLVPFAALPSRSIDSAAGAEQVLGDRFAVVQVPSASAWIRLKERREARRPAERLLAVVADPVFSAADSRVGFTGSSTVGLDRLTSTAEEARRIVELAREAGHRRPLIHQGFNATRELLIRGELSAFRILHLATHGLIDAEDPSLVGLAFSLVDSQGRPRDGLLRMRDLESVRLSADLVVLSACSTALGQRIRGEGVVGLTQAFWGSGPGSLVVSLWDVNDRATAELMSRFYRQLLVEGLPVSEALQRAQWELRNETSFTAPQYWAAFVVMGDGEVVF